MPYTNAQDLLRAARDAHNAFVARLSTLKPDPEGSIEAIRASQVAARHQRIVQTLGESIGGGEGTGQGTSSTWVQYDLSLDSQAFEAETEPFRSCGQAVAAGIELSSYFARLFEVAARQVSAPTDNAMLNDLAKLEEGISKEASWAQQQNADIAGG